MLPPYRRACGSLCQADTGWPQLEVGATEHNHPDDRLRGMEAEGAASETLEAHPVAGGEQAVGVILGHDFSDALRVRSVVELDTRRLIRCEVNPATGCGVARLQHRALDSRPLVRASSEASSSVQPEKI